MRTCRRPACSLRFLEQVSLVADFPTTSRTTTGVVALLTLHRQGSMISRSSSSPAGRTACFPHAELGDPTELCEERRLAYVGISPRQRRHMSSRAKVRSSWGQPMLNPGRGFYGKSPRPSTGTRTDTGRRPRRSGAPSRGAGPAIDRGRPAPMRSQAPASEPLIVLEPATAMSHDKYEAGPG